MDFRFFNGHEVQGVIRRRGKDPEHLSLITKWFVVIITFRFLSITSEHYNRMAIPQHMSHLSEGGTGV